MDKRGKTIAEDVAEKTFESWIVDLTNKDEPDDCDDCNGDCNGSCKG